MYYIISIICEFDHVGIGKCILNNIFLLFVVIIFIMNYELLIINLL